MVKWGTMSWVQLSGSVDWVDWVQWGGNGVLDDAVDMQRMCAVSPERAIWLRSPCQDGCHTHCCMPVLGVSGGGTSNVDSKAVVQSAVCVIVGIVVWLVVWLCCGWVGVLVYGRVTKGSVCD